MITDETWFLRFEGRAGERKSATLQTTNGEALAEIRAVDFHRRPNGPALRAAFVDNVRLMAASRELFRALGPLVRAAVELGLPEDHPLVADATAAIWKARPDVKSVTYDGAVRFVGTDDECFEFILRSQGQSVDYALAHGGWGIEPFVEDEPAFAWKDEETETSTAPGRRSTASTSGTERPTVSSARRPLRTEGSTSGRAGRSPAVSTATGRYWKA